MEGNIALAPSLAPAQAFAATTPSWSFVGWNPAPTTMSLYTLDGSTRKLLKLERFGQPDFSVKSFIEQLSGAQSHLDSDRRLDPKPYIRTFEAVANELERMHEIALNQEDAAGSATAELSESRDLEIQDMVSNVNTSVRDVKALDELAAEIQQITGLESTKLEHISHKNSQISKYRALISTYLSFMSGKPPTEFSRLWGTDMRSKVAFVAQLQAFATEIGKVEGKHDVLTQIDKFAENLENKLLSNFLENYQNFDLIGMRECAEILTEFNGGGSVVQAYINQHRFFMSVDELQPQEEDKKVASKALWQELVDPTSRFEEFSSMVDVEIKEITDTIARETEIITKVFPKPTQVLSIFIQRTFAQKLQGMVSLYTDEAANQEEYTDLAQVRVLSVCYSHVNNLMNDLQNTWSKPKSSLDQMQQAELGEVLESNFGDVFHMYIDGYIELEKTSLLEITKNLLQIAPPGSSSSSGSGGLQRTGTTATTYGGEDGRIERLRRMWSTRNDTTPPISQSPSETNLVGSSSNSSGLTNDRKGDLSINLNKVSNSPSADTSSIAETPVSARTPHYARLQQLCSVPISTLCNVLGAFAEAVSREQILRPPQDHAADAGMFYNTLTNNIGTSYINAILDTAIQISEYADTRSAIDWSFVESIKFASHVLRLLSTFVKTVLFAMVGAQSQSKMASLLNSYINSVQQSCVLLTEQFAEIMHLRTKDLFGKTNQKEFVDPQSENIVSNDLIEEFQNLAKYVTDTMSQANSKRLLQVVALNFCNDMHEHMSQYTTSMKGGEALNTDIAEFERLMTQDWGLSGEVSESFTTLRAISRLFAADRALLPSLLRDSHLAKFSQSQLDTYLRLRSDHNSKLTNMLYFQRY